MGRPKKIVTAEPKVEEINSPVAQEIQSTYLEARLDQAISLLERVVDKLDRQFEGRISSRVVETQEEKKSIKKEEMVSFSSYVPPEFREIVRELLNDKFDVRVTPLADSPSFQLMIVVPEKYSTLSDEHKKMYPEDIRARVISNGDGSIGVRAYVEKVWSSFNPTIQAMIVNDRTV